MKNYACFVISTGRCGTQWLTRQLTQLSQQTGLNNTLVEHEPLADQYAPLTNSPLSPLSANKKLLEQHLNEIRQTLARGENYIETGFPCWRHIQWFKEHLEVPVKVIHLIRHPVLTAISWLKLNAFVPPLLPHIQVKELFSPFAPEAKLSQYQQKWHHLSSFEKCLYYWAEVQLQALAYQQQWQDEHWLQIKYEKLFTEQSLDKLALFLDILTPAKQSSNKKTANTDDKIDSYGGIPQTDFNPEDIFRYPQIITLANTLGYRELAINKQTLQIKEQLLLNE